MGKIPETHKQLVSRAANWLLNSRKCTVVLTEWVGGGGSDIPDAIGWHGRNSIYVECKMSRSDFLADAKKYTRIDPDSGHRRGQQRVYLFPVGVKIHKQDIPDGWAAYEVGPYYVKAVIPLDETPAYIDKIAAAELPFLVSVLSRIQRGTAVYLMDQSPKETETEGFTQVDRSNDE